MQVTMRRSKVMEKIRAGKTAISVKLNLDEPRGVELAAMFGFDCIWIDTEHTPSTYSFMENAVRAAKLYDCDLLTRVSRGCYSDYIRPLEADSTGIMVPHVMSLEEAKQVVYYTKFHPIGRRPLDGGNADGKFCLIPGDEYMKQANEERFTIIQIEDPEPLDELEEICALPGLDMIFFGPADFSQGIGHPQDFANPKLVETRKRVAELARKYNKAAGTTGSPETLQARIDEGYNFVNIGADVVGLGAYYKSLYDSTLGKML